MRWIGQMIVGAGILGLAGTANAQRFDPRTHKGPERGVQNQVAVLATPHLSGLPKTFDPATLGPLIDRLAAWKPQAVAVETLSGLQCDSLRLYPSRYAETVESYCPDVSAAATATGLDVPAANAAAAALLVAWPKAPTAADRRKLAATFLAAGERDSALVQWLRLAPADRVTGDGIDAVLRDMLEKYRVRRNETTLIAAPLAARLGHERVWAMDDHTADSDDGADAKAAGAAIMAAWDNPANVRRQADTGDMVANIGTGAGVLAMYRRTNAAGQGQLAFDGDFGAQLNEPSAGRWGRKYLGYWETRNLRMAANIRSEIGMAPGSRVLVIVGASHKPYLDAYLDQMHDVRIVDVAPLLK